MTRMLQLMTRSAEGEAVRHLQAQLGMVGETLDVVGVEIAAPRIATPLAGEAVTRENIEPPAFIGLAKSLSAAFGQLPILVGMTGLSALGHGPNRSAYHRPLFRRKNATAQFTRAPLRHQAHRGLGPVSVGATLKDRRAPLGRDPHLDAGAALASGMSAAAPGSVPIEKSNRLPLAALAAPFEVGRKFLPIFRDRHPRQFRRRLNRTVRSLSHG